LSLIEKQACIGTGFVEIIVPSSVEILGKECFSMCLSLSSVKFESGSRLMRSEQRVLRQAGWVGREK
jgi:hypothetical protein